MANPRELSPEDRMRAAEKAEKAEEAEAAETTKRQQRDKKVPANGKTEPVFDIHAVFDAHEEEINNAIDFFQSGAKSEEFLERWLREYQDDPRRFFDEENLEKLKQMPLKERLALLWRTSGSILVTPDDAQRYYESFPEDLAAVYTIFLMQNGASSDSLTWSLFSFSSLEFQKLNPALEERIPAARQLLEIAHRRRLAPDFLLEGVSPKPIGEAFVEFGDGAQGFLDAYRDAIEIDMRGDRLMDAQRIFTPEYEAMNEEQKARFLRKALAELQYALVFGETFNSEFRRERVERVRQAMLRSEKKGLGWYNVGHSMLFGTYQPLSIYSADQKVFQRNMEGTVSRGGALEEYPFHKLILAVLDAMSEVAAKQDENTDLLVDFWNKNRNPIFGNGVADALSKQNPSRAAGKIMQMIREEKGNKRPLAAILYRLEFGRVGITEEGVRYLERQYDLGEYNNPDYFVRRLTAEGDMGIFDERRELFKHFNLGDITTDETRVRAAVLDFAYETLFTPRDDETPEERARRERMLEEFQKRYFTFFDDELFQKTKVFFNNLSFQEQGWYLFFVEQASQEKKKRAIDFAKTYGEEGLRTFLSLDYGDELGDHILDIGQYLPAPAAKSIFLKYGSIVRSLKVVNDFLRKQAGQRKEVADKALPKIVDRLREKGKDVLIQFAPKASQYRSLDEAGQQEMLSRLLYDLDRVRDEILLFGATFKELSKESEVKLEDIEGTEIAAVSSAELSEEEKKEMLEVFVENRRGRFPEDLLAYQQEQFRTILEKEEGRFYLLRHQGALAGFIRYEDLEDGRVLATSFNVPSYAQGLALGFAFFEATLEQEGVERPVVGNAWENIRALERYREMGFRVIGEETVETEEASYRYFTIERPPAGERNA